MKHPRYVSYCILLPALMVSTLNLSGDTFTSYHISKFRRIIQDTSSGPDSDSAVYGLNVLAFHTPEDAFMDGSFTPPESGSPIVMDMGGLPGSLDFMDDFYGTRQAVDAMYPTGDYLIELKPDEQTTLSATLALSSDPLPDPANLMNFDELQLMDPSQDILLTWDAPSLTGPEDCLQVFIGWPGSADYVYRSPDPGLPGALPADTTSLLIPANTMLSNEFYTLEIYVHDVTTVDTTQITGATGTASLTTITTIDFETGTAPVVDLIPPLLINVNPPVGENDVDPATSVTFTFSEPMAPSVGILWEPAPSGGSYSWSVDQTTLTYTTDNPFPNGETVRWTLNPGPGYGIIADLAGNPIPTNSVTGTFATALGNLSTAPAEWLPGPKLVIGPSEDIQNSKVQFAAESLKGYNIEKSDDLSDWNTIATVLTDDSMIELDLPKPSPGERVFYRAANYGIPPAIVTEEGSSVREMIPPDGGILTTTGSDGTIYTLTIPAGALPAPEFITMTPIEEIIPFPLSQGMVAGVLLEPDGLQLQVPAELRMAKPDPVDPVDLTGFNGKSNGMDFFWHPWSVENGNEIVLKLFHFSIQGAGHGTDSDVDSQPQACDPIPRLKQAIASLLRAAARADAAGDEESKQNQLEAIVALAQDVYITHVEAAFTKAKTDRNLLPCAIRDWLHVEEVLATWDPDYDGFNIPTDAHAAFQFAWNTTMEKCSQGDFREIANLLWIAEQDQMLAIGVTDGSVLSEIAECLYFKLDFESELYYNGWQHKGHHKLEAKDISLDLLYLGGMLTGSGTLLNQIFELENLYPVGCEPEMKDLSTTNGYLNIEGMVVLKNNTKVDCNCNNPTMDPTGSNALDFGLVITTDGATESWKESDWDSESGECFYLDYTYVEMWQDCFAGAHEDFISEELSGEFYSPLVIAVNEFDPVDKESNGRRMVAQKQIYRSLPEETLFYWYRNIASKTTITIWHDPPTPPAN